MRVRHFDSERGNIHYSYDGNAILDERDADTSALIAHYNYADRLLSLTQGTDTQFYHYSALRTTANLTDESGRIQVSYHTDPWGSITEQQGLSINRQVFTGQEHDENTGLIYFGARYYDPATARFINQDPYLGEFGTPPSLHRYLYAYSNPTVYVDPNGNIVLKHGEDAFNEIGDNAIKAGGDLLNSDSYIDKGIGAVSALSGGISKAVGFVFGVGNYVENQAILSTETLTGIIPEESIALAVGQTGAVYDGIGAAATTIGTTEGRAAAGQALSDHTDRVLAGEGDAIASTLGFVGEAFAPGVGTVKAVGSGVKALKTTTNSISKAKLTTMKTLTFERMVKAGGQRVSELKNSAVSFVKESRYLVTQTNNSIRSAVTNVRQSKVGYITYSIGKRIDLRNYKPQLATVSMLGTGGFKSLHSNLQRASSYQIRKIAGAVRGDGMQVHHLNSLKMAKEFPELFERAAKAGYQINHKMNLLKLAGSIKVAKKSKLPLHRGNHLPEYYDLLRLELSRLNKNLDDFTNLELKAGLEDIQKIMKNAIMKREVYLNKNDPFRL